jgi:hypothetical protein
VSALKALGSFSEIDGLRPLIQSMRYPDGRIFVQFDGISYWTRKDMEFPVQVWGKSTDLPILARIATVLKSQNLIKRLEALHKSGYSDFELREVLCRKS